MVAKMGHLYKPQVSIISDIERLTDPRIVHEEHERLWVFGYGSLLWKTGFKYNNKVIGHVDGYVRRFWQGNVTHRGTPDLPGRVATLIKRPMGRAWGIAFEVTGSQIMECVDHLGMRECMLGGYDIMFVKFHPRGCPGVTIPALVFNASTDNPYYVGKSPVDVLAQIVVEAEGATGHNIEYVLRLAEYVRHVIPEDQDEHLFSIERHILRILDQKQISQETLVEAASKRTHLYTETQNARCLSPFSRSSESSDEDEITELDQKQISQEMLVEAASKRTHSYTETRSRSA